MQASPLHQIIKRFDTKSDDRTEARKKAKNALIKALQAFTNKGDVLEDEFSDKGIKRVSNRKLLRLLETAELVQDEFGSRSAMIDKLLDIEGRQKDAGYREHLEGFRLPTLYSRYQAALKRTRS